MVYFRYIEGVFLLTELKRLIDVKSIVTVALTLVVCYLAIVGKMDVKDLYLIVISFYFGTQAQKKEDKYEAQNQTTARKRHSVQEWEE